MNVGELKEHIRYVPDSMEIVVNVNQEKIQKLNFADIDNPEGGWVLILTTKKEKQ